MNELELASMLKALRPVLNDKEKARYILQRYWSHKLALIWTVADIHKAANERGRTLTRKEAKELLDNLKLHYNRQYGIRWTDLWDLIDSSGFGRKMTKLETKDFVNRGYPVICKPEKR